MSARDDWPATNDITGDPYEQMCDEIDRLRRWKAEAMQVLDHWETVWETAGRPGPLGYSKAAAIQALIADLQIENASLTDASAPDEVNEEQE
jgi:hypothetical protein